MATDALKLNVYSPVRKLVEDVSVRIVTLPTSEGEIQVLPGHVPMMGTLEPGILSYEAVDGARGEAVLSFGFFRIEDDRLSVMAETLELAGEIDLERASLARRKAEQALGQAATEEEVEKFVRKLRRAHIREGFAGDKPTKH